MKSFKQKLGTALIIDLLLHFLVFQAMATNLNEGRYAQLSWWNEWAYQILFSYEYDNTIWATSLSPAKNIFGNGWFSSILLPYLVILFFVMFGSYVWRISASTFSALLSVAKSVCYTMILVTKSTIVSLSPFIKTHMKKLENWFYNLIGYIPETDTSKGSSRFSAEWETKLFLDKKYTGLLIDSTRRMKRSLSVRHIAVIAPSGQGKTVSYVIPNVLGLPEWVNPTTRKNASIVITDPKGEIYDLTAKYLQDEGYTIKVIEVDKPLQSEHFNPLKRANSDKELAKVAQMIVASGLPDAKAGDFWTNSTKMLLTTILKIVKRSIVPEEYQNLHNVKRFVDLMGGDGTPLIEYVANHCTDVNAITEYGSFVQQDGEALSNILLTLKSVLKDLAVQDICQLTKDDTLNFEILRSEKTALYIITPFSDIEYYRFVLTILYSQIFSFCDKVEEGNDIVFMLDEFGNLGKIPGFSQLITTLRSKGCSLSIILQDIEQLRGVYGRSGASTIINGGCSSKIFFGGIQNLETLKEISQMLGSQTLEQKSSDGKELNTIARPLLLPDEINKMKMGTGLFVSAGQHPVELAMKQYSDTSLKNRVKKDAFGTVVSVPKPKDKTPSVLYFPFDNYIQAVVEG